MLSPHLVNLMPYNASIDSIFTNDSEKAARHNVNFIVFLTFYLSSADECLIVSACFPSHRHQLNPSPHQSLLRRQKEKLGVKVSDAFGDNFFNTLAVAPPTSCIEIRAGNSNHTDGNIWSKSFFA